MIKSSPILLENVVLRLCPEVQARLPDTRVGNFSEEELLAEAVCCLLSSQVSYTLAQTATQRIADAGLLRLDIGSTPEITFALKALLKEPLRIKSRHIRYRFPNVATKRISALLSQYVSEKRLLSDIVYAARPIRERRRVLVERIIGFGPKQASMFLRNIGASFDVAILDRHVFSYMHALGLLQQSARPASHFLAYEKLENSLKRYADGCGYPVGCLDWAIWIVMKVARRRGLL